ncbi:MAG: DUF1003 domain-containing protein [Candidatus Aminicenantes bacterium]|nr:DUF1003 domain-containing protein [Candidatus Aminicenantes bacterium]
MTARQKTPLLCEVCQQPKKMSDLFPLEMVHDSVLKIIQEEHPDIQRTGHICSNDLNAYRIEFIKRVLEEEKGELSVIEEEVIRSIKDHDTVAKDINAEYEQSITFGEKISDKLASFGGSWKFIISFFVVLLFWIVLNSVVILTKIFDPYPFILLNLVLSCLAAIQAPIILMSQNRQDSKDRIRSDYDYRVNLKAELEIRHLHQKLDYFLKKEWQALLEIQQIQVELMKELSERKEK